MTARTALLDAAVRAWLASPIMLTGSPPAAAIHRYALQRRVSIWDRRAIADQFRRLQQTAAQEADRQAFEMTIESDIGLSAGDGRVIPARAGDRLIYIPGERVRYPFSIQFPDGMEVVMEDPTKGPAL